MVDPGVDRHAWESEIATLDDELRDDPTSALPDRYELTDPVVRDGDERASVAEFLAAREIRDAYERGSEELSAGDIAAAINGSRAIFDYLVATRAAADAEA